MSPPAAARARARAVGRAAVHMQAPPASLHRVNGGPRVRTGEPLPRRRRRRGRAVVAASLALFALVISGGDAAARPSSMRVHCLRVSRADAHLLAMVLVPEHLIPDDKVRVAPPLHDLAVLRLVHLRGS